MLITMCAPKETHPPFIYVYESGCIYEGGGSNFASTDFLAVWLKVRQDRVLHSTRSVYDSSIYVVSAQKCQSDRTIMYWSCNESHTYWAILKHENHRR